MDRHPIDNADVPFDVESTVDSVEHRPAKSKRKGKKQKTDKKRERARSKDKPWLAHLVYKYGAGAPVEAHERVSDLIYRGHKFRNEMVALERARRDRVQAEVRAMPGTERLAQLDIQIPAVARKCAELRAQKKAGNSAARKKKRNRPLDLAIKALVGTLTRLRKEATALRDATYASNAWKAKEAELTDWVNAETKRIYNQDPDLTAWGTKVRIAEETSKSRSGPPPKFKSWDRSGKVVVQLQGGLDVKVALACTDSFLRIQRVPEGIYVPGARKGVRDPVTGERRKLTPEEVEKLGIKRLDSEGYPMKRLGDAWVWMRIDTNETQVESRAKSYLARKERAASKGKEIEPKLVKSSEPVWCKFPIVMHRDLPLGAKIKFAWLQRRRRGPNLVWDFQLVLEEDTRLRAPDPDAETSGCLAVDVNWRVMRSATVICGFETKCDKADCADGPEEHKHIVHDHKCPRGDIRVGYWKGSDGKKGELRLPARLVCGLYQCYAIQSIRDTRFNDARTALLDWSRSQQLPQWLTERLKHAHQWKRVVRLATTVHEWRRNRFADDEEIFSLLNAWEKRDRHLFDYEANLRDQIMGWRDDLYRKFVRQMRRNYSVVFLEDINMAELAKRKDPEESHLEEESVRRHRSIAAISALRQYFKEKMRVVKVEAAGTSYICNKCGYPSFKGMTGLMLKCGNPACSVTVDRDENSVDNILDRGYEILKARAAKL